MKGCVFSLKEHRLLISLAPVVNGEASLLLTLSDKISSSRQSSLHPTHISTSGYFSQGDQRDKRVQRSKFNNVRRLCGRELWEV